jgi:hypothetical protein
LILNTIVSIISVVGFENKITKFSHLLRHFKHFKVNFLPRSLYQALIASKDTSSPTPTPTPPPKINKPPPKKEGEPEVIEFENRTWKWCDKCFGGYWNRTHVTEEHQPGKGRSKNRRPPPSTSPTNNTTESQQQQSSSPAPPQPTNEANVATTSKYNMDFI